MELQVLTVSGEEGTGFLWDLHTGNLAARFVGCTAGAGQLAAAGRGVFFSAATDQPKLMGWAWGHEQPRSRSVTPEKLRSVAITPDAVFLLGGGESGTVYCWELGSGRLLAGFPGHYGAVGSIAVADDGELVCTGGDDAIVHTWRLGDLVVAGASVPTERGSWTEHSLPVTAVRCGSGGLAGHIVTASQDQTIKVWQPMQEPHCVLSVSLPTPLSCVAIDSLERSVATAGEDGMIYHLPLVLVPGAPTQHVLAGHTAPVLSLAITFDGALLVSCSRDQTARVWDLASAQQVLSFTLHAGAVSSCLILSCFNRQSSAQQLVPLHRRLPQHDDPDEVKDAPIPAVQLASSGSELLGRPGGEQGPKGDALHELQVELAAERERADHWEGLATELQKSAVGRAAEALK